MQKLNSILVILTLTYVIFTFTNNGIANDDEDDDAIVSTSGPSTTATVNTDHPNVMKVYGPVNPDTPNAKPTLLRREPAKYSMSVSCYLSVNVNTDEMCKFGIETDGEVNDSTGNEELDIPPRGKVWMLEPNEVKVFGIGGYVKTKQGKGRSITISNNFETINPDTYTLNGMGETIVVIGGTSLSWGAQGLSQGSGDSTFTRPGNDDDTESFTVKEQDQHPCQGCNKHKKEGETHEEKTCSSYYYGSMLLYGCGDQYWTCASDVSDHTNWSYCSRPGTFHGYKDCVADQHTIQASCSETDGNGNMCTVTNYYPCEFHTHQFGSGSQSGSGSGSQQGNGGGQQGNNGGGQQGNNGGGQQGNNGGGQQGNNQNNGGDPPSTGNLPPSNGGCTTTAAACINTNCQLSPPCTTFTCGREIIVDRSGPRHSWIIRPCGATFTKCQDGTSLSLRGDCTGDRVTTIRSYHSEEYR